MERLLITYGFASLMVAMALTGAAAPAAAQDKKPNIVFMLADNLGYGELGSYGGGILRRTHPAH